MVFSQEYWARESQLAGHSGWSQKPMPPSGSAHRDLRLLVRPLS